jgi:hypothetical protein
VSQLRMDRHCRADHGIGLWVSSICAHLRIKSTSAFATRETLYRSFRREPHSPAGSIHRTESA